MKDNFVKFADIAEKVFTPIYPVIASDIVKMTNIVTGTCIDIGSGTAILSRSLAKITKLKIFTLDRSQDMCKLAKHYIKQEKLSIETFAANVEYLPIKSSSVDLVISRGSMFFWNNKIRAFGEIYRVLKPGGMAYIGGGFGNKIIKERIVETMKIIKPSWENENKNRLTKMNPYELEKIMRILKITHYQIIYDERGLWILITGLKP